MDYYQWSEELLDKLELADNSKTVDAKHRKFIKQMKDMATKDIAISKRQMEYLYNIVKWYG